MLSRRSIILDLGKEEKKPQREENEMKIFGDC